MARAKEFDRDEALRKALDCFWEKGFEATSINDLVARTGIQRGSLYDTFGSKHELYIAALDRYSAQQFQLDPNTGLDGVRALFQSVIANAGERGCFLLNASMERADCDNCVHERIDLALADLEKRIHSALKVALDRHQIVDRPLRPAARLLVATVLGMRVMMKAGMPKAVLYDTARAALETLR